MSEFDPFTAPAPVVLPVEGDPERFYVRCNETFYECRVGSESRAAECECPHRRHRGAFCKHLQAIERYQGGGWPTAAEEQREWTQLSEAEKKAVFA